jgi:hypothetical protein
MSERAGGCLCGTVRFRLGSEPFDAGWCHCRTCQLNSGSPAMAFASAPVGDYRLVAGQDVVRTVASSSFGHRGFCGNCGTPLYMKVDHQPETVDLSIATLDDPGEVRPGFHIFWASRVPWFEIEDSLPKFDRFRPDIRGLEGTDPPD